MRPTYPTWGRPRRRSRWRVALLVVASLVTVGVAAFVVVRERSGHTGPTAAALASPTTAATSTTVSVTATAKVLVANGSGVTGAARKASDALAAAGWTTLTPTNARTADIATSSAYFLPGYQPHATAVARALAIVAIAPWPASGPVETIDDANVIVVLGTDR